MTTEDIIIHIFYQVDNGLGPVAKEACAKLYPSEVVTIGILFALKGGRFRAFYRWLKRDFEQLFAGLPDRTNLLRELRVHQALTDLLFEQPSLLNVVDSYPIELIFPIRQGRSKQQFGAKSRDKGRWSVRIKLCWILNRCGQVCGWLWHKMNYADKNFLDFFEEYDGHAVILAHFAFRCSAAVP